MILARVKLWAAAIGAAILGALGLMAKAKRDGRKQERVENRAKAAENQIKTIKEIERAIDHSRAPGASWRDRLRAHRDKR